MCNIKHNHQNQFDEIKENILSDETYDELSETFKIFSSQTRLKIMSILAVEELCVCDICDILDMSQSAVSHQLRVLRGKNLVKFTKEGKQARYSLADKHVVEILQIGIEHVLE